MRKIIGIALLLVALLSALPGSGRDTLVFHSSFLPVPDTVVVYTPASYASTDTAYPLLYMLHGLGGNYNTFTKIIDPQHYADEYHMIIVLPDGLRDSWYIDAPHSGGTAWESFFIKELYPGIRKAYRCDSLNTFISGYSMGGYGALYLFFRHSALFGAAAASSAVADLSYSHARKESLQKLLGPYPQNKDLYHEYSLARQLEYFKESGKSFSLDCGKKDYLFEANEQLFERCMEKQLLVYFMEMNGRHNYQYWKMVIPGHFAFYALRLRH